MKPSEVRRVLHEAGRQARTQSRTAASYSGVQKASPVHAGTTNSGQWVAYGRVGITSVSAGFRVRSEARYGRVGVTPISDGFRVQGA
ncbi:MAG: hypothetical protein ACO1SX_19125 [Actinomycetota bacterium]